MPAVSAYVAAQGARDAASVCPVPVEVAPYAIGITLGLLIALAIIAALHFRGKRNRHDT